MCLSAHISYFDWKKKQKNKNYTVWSILSVNDSDGIRFLVQLTGDGNLQYISGEIGSLWFVISHVRSYTGIESQ